MVMVAVTAVTATVAKAESCQTVVSAKEVKAVSVLRVATDNRVRIFLTTKTLLTLPFFQPSDIFDL